MAGEQVILDQVAVDVEFLVAGGVLDHHELVPGVDDQLVEGDVGEGHFAVAVDGPVEEAALVHAQAEVDEVRGGREPAFVALAQGGDAAAEEGLFAGAAGVEPAAHGHGRDAVELLGDRLHAGLVGDNALDRTFKEVRRGKGPGQLGAGRLGQIRRR